MKKQRVENKKTKKKASKKNNGITLIALVITIIVLLILAGVSIATLTGENGILTRASEANERTKEANAEEQVQLAVTASIGTDGKINLDNLNNELKKIEGLTYKGNPISDDNKIESLPAIVTVDGYDIMINENGNIEQYVPLNGNYYETDTDITVGGKPVTIPGGATISGIAGEYENVDDGLVIYITNGDTITDWSDAETIQQTYDQFVWVPVEKAFVTETEIGGNSYDNLKNYVLTNGIYPMAIQLSDGSYKGILYTFTEENGAITITPKDYTTTSSYREPDVVDDDKDTTYLNQINGILNTSYSTAEAFKSELQLEYKAMVERVDIKGGFWVGRYETSNMSNSTTTTYADSNKIQVGVKKGKSTGISSVTWYRMYAQQEIYSDLALTNSAEIRSSMIWGSQWDQIMIWMKDKKNTVNTANGQYYVTNAVGMGNFGSISGVDDGWSNITSPAPTGYQESYEVKKIYDLAGNVYDWTLEADLTGSRVRRRR